MRVCFQHGQAVEKLPEIQLNAFVVRRPILNHAFVRRNAAVKLLPRFGLPIRQRHDRDENGSALHFHAQRFRNRQDAFRRIRQGKALWKLHGVRIFLHAPVIPLIKRKRQPRIRRAHKGYAVWAEPRFVAFSEPHFVALRIKNGAVEVRFFCRHVCIKPQRKVEMRLRIPPPIERLHPIGLQAARPFAVYIRIDRYRIVRAANRRNDVPLRRRGERVHHHNHKRARQRHSPFHLSAPFVIAAVCVSKSNRMLSSSPRTPKVSACGRLLGKSVCMQTV